MPKRILEGDVVSDKMDKTVTVLVERRYRHPVYKKYIKRTDKYAAHDETNSFRVGDRVQIEECRPISRRKTWTVITVPAAGMARESMSAPKEVVEKPVAKKAVEKKTETKKVAKKAVAKKTTKKATSKKKDDSQ